MHIMHVFIYQNQNEQLGTLTSGWYVPTLWFPQSIDVAQTEGSTIHCCYVTEWNRHSSDNRRGKCSTTLCGIWVNEICIPRLWPLFNDQGGRGPELRPIIHDLALYWHWLHCAEHCGADFNIQPAEARLSPAMHIAPDSHCSTSWLCSDTLKQLEILKK